LIVVACLAAVIGYAAHSNCDECEVCTVCEVPEPCECEVCEVTECEVIECADTADDLLDVAIEDLLEHMDDEDLFVCDGDEYDVDEVTVKKIYYGYSVVYLDDDEYEVSGEIRLNFKQKDERRCRETVDFTVLYEEGEDPEITIW